MATFTWIKSKLDRNLTLNGTKTFTNGFSALSSVQLGNYVDLGNLTTTTIRGKIFAPDQYLAAERNNSTILTKGLADDFYMPVSQSSGSVKSIMLSADYSVPPNGDNTLTSSNLQLTLSAGTWNIECLMMVDGGVRSTDLIGSVSQLTITPLTNGNTSNTGGISYYGLDNGSVLSFPNLMTELGFVGEPFLTNSRKHSMLRLVRYTNTVPVRITAQFRHRFYFSDATNQRLLKGSYIRVFESS